MTIFTRRSRDREILRKITTIERKQMATQEQVDALTAAVGTVSADLATAKTTIQAEIDKLAGEHPQVNLEALTTAVDALDPAVQALDQLKPETPAP
jgi:hypothetical protein